MNLTSQILRMGALGPLGVTGSACPPGRLGLAGRRGNGERNRLHALCCADGQDIT
jgi:hypothetical protein